MLEDEFKTLLHRIALALGIAQSHPDPAAYADEVINAHDSINAKIKIPDPVIETPVLTETKIYADGSSATGPAPLPDQSPAEQDAADAQKEDAGNVPAVVASSVVDAAITSTDTATTSSEQPAPAEGEAPAAS